MFEPERPAEGRANFGWLGRTGTGAWERKVPYRVQLVMSEMCRSVYEVFMGVDCALTFLTSAFNVTS